MTAAAEETKSRTNAHQTDGKRKGPRRRFLPRTLLQWLEGGLKVGLIVGACLGAAEYYDRQQQARVERVLGFIERFEGAPLSEARSKVSAAMYANRDMIVAVNELAQDPASDPALIAQMWRDAAMATALDSNGGAGVEAEIAQILEFFSGLEICVSQHVCDAATARAFFSDFAVSFWRFFEPYAMERRREATPSFGRDLEHFAARS